MTIFFDIIMQNSITAKNVCAQMPSGVVKT